MASTTGIDELNIVPPKQVSQDTKMRQIRRYFEEMELPEEEIEQRIAVADDLETVFRNLFLLIYSASVVESIMGGASLESQSEQFTDYATRGYGDALVNNNLCDYETLDTDGYVVNYIRTQCKQIVDMTILHLADQYYTSMERSIFCGENETNAIANYFREQEMIRQGFTQKTWVTMMDNKVRHSHKKVNGETIGIFDAFTVGGFKMLFPQDRSQGADAKECINCRCSLVYSDQMSYSVNEGNSKTKLENHRLFNESEKINTSGEKAYALVPEKINVKEYKDKFDAVTDNTVVNTRIHQESISILNHRGGTNLEDLSVIELRTGNVLHSIRNSTKPFGVEHDEITKEILHSYNGGLLVIHNHPNSTRPSLSDIWSAMGYSEKTGMIEYTSIEKILVIGHNGSVYEISEIKRDIDIAKQFDEVYNQAYNYYMDVLTDKNKTAFATTKAMDAVYAKNDEVKAFVFKEL